MIGIQLGAEGGAAAVWRESGPEVLGSGGDIAELVALARQQGEDCTTGVVAVPAWYHDGQRSEVIEQAKAAGMENVRLMNEPAAVTLAYGAAQAALPKAAMVLQLADSGVFDVTLIGVEGIFVEVLAANGIADLQDQVADQLFAAIQPVVNSALNDAECKPSSLDAILLTGRTDVLQTIAPQIEASWGQAPAQPPSPEAAIACGAAVYCGFLETRQ